MTYEEYIMENAEIPICNGDMLLEAVERGYLLEEYQHYLKGQK